MWWNEDDRGASSRSWRAAKATGSRSSYPAINEDGDEYLLPDDSIVQILPGSDIFAGAKMTRLHNTAIHPARATLPSWRCGSSEFVAAGQKRWNALYQQKPDARRRRDLFSKEMQ